MLVKLQALQEQPPDAFCKKGVLRKVFTKFIGKACVRDSILIKNKYVHVNLANFRRTRFLQNTYRRLLMLLAFRSSHGRCSMKKDVLENFAKFTGKHLWFSEFSKTPFLQNTPGRLLLAFSCNATKIGYCQQFLEKLR